MVRETDWEISGIEAQRFPIDPRVAKQQAGENARPRQLPADAEADQAIIEKAAKPNV